MFTRPLLIAAALVAALAGAATAGVVTKSSATVKTVTAPVREYHISLSVRHVPAGAVKLVVVNRGKLTHHIEIKGPGVTKKTPMLKPGAKATLKFTAKSGKYTIWCTIPGHAALGMKAVLTAGTAAASGGGTTASTTTTSPTTTSDNGWG
jgi:uncharacterized cupredoxin-like copper-binding protein